MRTSSSPFHRLLRLFLAAVVGAAAMAAFVPTAEAVGSTLTGTAVWDFNQSAVPFAEATLFREGLPTLRVTADANGSFTFADVPDGPWRLSVTSPCGVPSRVDLVLPAAPQVAALSRQHDTFGYRCSTGTQNEPPAGTPLALTGDDATTNVTLPFVFPFYGTDATAITVSTNGWISALPTSNSAPTNTALPSPGSPDKAVYAFWDDLVVDGSSSVRTATDTNGANERFEVQWLNVALKSDPAQRLDVYARLNGANDSISVFHFDVGTGSGEQGAGATLGIEGPSGITAVEVSRDERVARNGRSYLFVPLPSPPVARAGDPQVVASDASFTLDASGSSDADGGPLTFQWTQVVGPPATIDDRTKVRPSVRAPRGPAQLRFQVTVKDVFGATDVDDVVIDVKAPASK